LDKASYQEEKMSPQEFDELVERTYSEIQTLISVKGGEYANDTERFENFIRNGKRLDLHRLIIWAVYFNKHVDAINSYVATLQKGQVRESSEPIEGRFIDAIVYLLLGLGMLEEDIGKPKQIKLQERPDGWYYIEKEGEVWRPYTLCHFPRIHVGIHEETLDFPAIIFSATYQDHVVLAEIATQNTIKVHGIMYKSGIHCSVFHRIQGKWVNFSALTHKP
jgi:hypothetical protein